MKQERHFENVRGRSAGEAERLGTVIEDLRRIVQALDCDVAAAAGQSRTEGHSDAAQAALLSNTLATRRDNLKSTIATLEARLPKSSTMAGPI
ncbi:MAG: hypothetical protein KGL62_03905 [Bradyrhizobium sp.]|uniref:hypothetical protein n=1 Tax=Bradyrhizobium sp. TaxID=376 RepID=UPI0023A38D0F|nr:hypothetical protein [Bradyrhizobium sp.]MDE2601497.1 hypothetical protein [Bradyrhizobium sp.]